MRCCCPPHALSVPVSPFALSACYSRPVDDLQTPVSSREQDALIVSSLVKHLQNPRSLMEQVTQTPVLSLPAKDVKTQLIVSCLAISSSKGFTGWSLTPARRLGSVPD